jgi:hypothetical protein
MAYPNFKNGPKNSLGPLGVKWYGVLMISVILWAGSQPLSMQQFLPKTAQRQNFEIPPKI